MEGPADHGEAPEDRSIERQYVYPSEHCSKASLECCGIAARINAVIDLAVRDEC
jgi:hypothetical protein